MKLELSIVFYEDNNVKMEIKDGKVSFISKSNMDVKQEDLDFSFNVMKYLLNSINEMNEEDEELKCSII